MTYTEVMRRVALHRFDDLHRGVVSIEFTDFPDHSNVGDSAIALGQWSYWQLRGVEVSHIYSAPVIPAKLFASRATVFIHGGGNFGGLYPPLNEHRYRLAESLDPATLLIQGSQSVHFVNDRTFQDFLRRMAPRKKLRVAVRDQYSFDLLRPHVEDLLLVPDAVHLLGDIAAPEPTQRVVRLSRADIESASQPGQRSVDWSRDPLKLAVPWWFSWRTKQLPAIQLLYNRQPTWWMRKAEDRFQRGVKLLSVGETIVTDRLHAMLIGLQMGRKVVARDNSNGKLSRYINTWFRDERPDNLVWDEG